MKEIKPEEVPKLIPDGAGIALGGFVGCGFPELLAVEIEKGFLEKGTPRDLAIFFAARQGDAQKRGLNHLGMKGCCVLLWGAILVWLRDWSSLF